MRILYASFDQVPAPKGASTHITQFIEALAEAYPTPTLLTLGSRPSRPESRYFGAWHLRIPVPPGNFLVQALFFRDAVAEHLRRERYEVVHFRSIWEGLPAVYAQEHQGFRTVYEVNGLPSLELPYHYPALRHHPGLLERLREQEQECLRAATAVITPSAVTQRYLLHRGVPPERITVIPNGVDPRIFYPAPLDPGRGDRPLRLLYVGTLAPWQGLPVLLEAVSKARRERALEVWLLGPSQRLWRKDLEKRIRQRNLEDCVHFLPPRDPPAVAAVIRSADLCVAPLANTARNRVQGCNPIKLFEYMACRKPILAARLPVIQEVLTEGEEALLYRPDDPRRLRNALLRLASDPALAEQLAGRAYEKAIQHYTWARARARLLEVYERIGAGSA